jgi:two-component system, OmpR family, sensor kinase
MVRPRTIRAKLTLTTVLVMSAVLSVLGVIVYLAASRSLLSGIDQDLQRRGNESEQAYARAVKRWREGDQSRGPFRGPSSDPLRTLRPRFFRVNSDLPLPESTYEPYSAAALRDGKAGIASYVTIRIEGQPVRIHTRPVLDSGKVATVTQIPYALTDTYRALQNLGQILLFLIPLGAILTAVASRFLIDRLMRPIHLITQDAEKIGAQTLDERLPVVGQDEFAYLGSTLNGMLNRLQQGFEVEQETSRRLEASLRQQRRFSADASHELKTPLAVIKANVSVVGLEPTTPNQVEALGAIDDAASRMNRLVQGLLLLGKAEGGIEGATKEPCLLAEVVKRAVRQTSPANTNIEIAVEDDSATVVGVFDDLVRMVQNLVDNAAQHSGGDLIQVILRSEGAADVIEVKDNGKGISAEHLPHLFDRFYRVDESRNSETGGTGLGLAIARGIAESHEGTLDVASEPGRGTVFTVRLRPSGNFNG